MCKDLLLDLRSRDRLGHMMLFAAIVSALMSIALPPVTVDTRAWVPPLIWVIFLLTSLLGLGRSFQAELEGGGIVTLAQVACDRGWIFAGKMAANWLTLAGLQVWTALLFALFLNVPWIDGYRVSAEANTSVNLVEALGMTWLGAGGLSAIGTLFAGISTQARNREFLLPVLLLPLMLPVLVIGSKATLEVLESRPIPSLWWGVLGLYVWIFILLGYFTFDHVLED